MLRSIAHPTDFSGPGILAFEHALSLALANRCRLDVLHVDEPGGGSGWANYPQVRATLQRWGILAAGTSVDAVEATTGVTVRKVGIRDRDPIDGIVRYLDEHHADLLVMASHGRAGLERLFNTSVSANLAQAVAVPALILGPSARSLVDPANGRMALDKILVPVDHEPDPQRALEVIEQIAQTFAAPLDFVHVGDAPPALRDGATGARPVRVVSGNAVEAILAEARAASAIAMPMAGAHGLVDALRGSTTEQVVRGAGCPVLAVPIVG